MSDPAINKAPLMVHLIEFRRRLIVCLAVFLFAFCVSYNYAEAIYAFLVQPLADSFANPESKRLIYTSLGEAFVTYMQLSLFSAFIMSIPVIAIQLYLFLAPGLYKREKKVLVPYLVMSPVLFAAGAWLAYDYVFPAAWAFFASFETTGAETTLPIVLEARVGDYLALVMQVVLAFGLAFQLPVLLTLLVRMGMLKTDTLAGGRKYAVIIILVVAGVLTPPDVISQIGLSIPLYLLYEISIFCCRIIERQRAKEEMVNTHA